MSWTPTGEPWADYYLQLFPGHTNPRTAFDSWKYASTAVNVTVQLWETRERGRQRHVAEFGADPDAWPTAHPPIVLWLPEAYFPACLGCAWISRSSVTDLAGTAARGHAAAPGTDISRVNQPVPVLPRNGPHDGGAYVHWV